jgi:hypothetical protein
MRELLCVLLGRLLEEEGLLVCCWDDPRLDERESFDTESTGKQTRSDER